jgi:hypothetical protein
LTLQPLLCSASSVCVHGESHNNRRGDAGSVLCEYAPRPYSVQRVSAVQLRFRLWSANQRVTEAEESPLLIRYQETSSEDIAVK